MAGLVGAAGGVLAWTSARHVAFCSGADPPTTQASHEGLKSLRSWLKSHGAQIDTIVIAPGSQVCMCRSGKRQCNCRSVACVNTNMHACIQHHLNARVKITQLTSNLKNR